MKQKVFNMTCTRDRSGILLCFAAWAAQHKRYSGWPGDLFTRHVP